MTDRIVDISRSPAKLSVKHKQLVIDQTPDGKATMPLADLAVVVVSHPQVTYTQAVLACLAESGGAFVACNRQYLPVGLFLPLVAHFTQAERFAAQAGAGQPLRKRLWQQVVREKIRSQARTLQVLYGSDFGLSALIPQVKSGDTSNVEARAARRYWPQLFLDVEFRRNRDNQDQNLLLNYGYAVLRAIVARAICGAGLHPSLGIHHHNRYNAFCLADDLMEPFRPTVDMAVVEYMSEHDEPYGVESAAKQHLIERLTGLYVLDGAQRTLFDTVTRLAASLAEAFMTGSGKLVLPEQGDSAVATASAGEKEADGNGAG
jgi:CRISP-associated protein Cas1